MRLATMESMRAEVIAIGDELTSGQRLDTNSQWLSERLVELGVDVAFHTTIGDDLADNVAAFRAAIARVDVVVATGGLGPQRTTSRERRSPVQPAWTWCRMTPPWSTCENSSLGEPGQCRSEISSRLNFRAAAGQSPILTARPPA